MYKDINNKTGYRNLQGNNFLYGNMKLLSTTEKTSALADGITEWIAPVKALPTESEQLITNKSNVSNAIKNDFELIVLEAITVATINYHGGYESSIKLDAAKRLAELAGNTTVDFYDTINVSHTLSIVNAEAVILAIGSDYQTKFAIKQGLLI
ncbi:MAG: hypothetical protein KAJ73_04880, partial [Zetaproteobacteria bacterium]|nr:hypothetical protein [Zetaproteobacteria bacterium]